MIVPMDTEALLFCAHDLRALGQFLRAAAKAGDKDAVFNLTEDLRRVLKKIEEAQ